MMELGRLVATPGPSRKGPPQSMSRKGAYHEPLSSRLPGNSFRRRFSSKGPPSSAGDVPLSWQCTAIQTGFALQRRLRPHARRSDRDGVDPFLPGGSHAQDVGSRAPRLFDVADDLFRARRAVRRSVRQQRIEGDGGTRLTAMSDCPGARRQSDVGLDEAVQHALDRARQVVGFLIKR